MMSKSLSVNAPCCWMFLYQLACEFLSHPFARWISTLPLKPPSRAPLRAECSSCDGADQPEEVLPTGHRRPLQSILSKE